MRSRDTILRISKLVGKIGVRFIFYFSIVLIIALLLAQVKPVQTFLTKKVLIELSERTKHNVSISSVKIAWLDRAELNDLLILDRKSDTLVFAKRILVNYKLTDILNSEFLNVEEVVADKMHLQLIKHDSLSLLNLSELLNALKNPNKKNRPISVEAVSLGSLDFSISNNTKEVIENRLDVAHLDMHFSEMELANFELRNDTIMVDVIQLSGVESRHGLELKELSSRLELNNQSLSLTNLNLQTASSQVSDSIKLYYNGIANLSHFVDSVSFGLYFSDTRISAADLKILTGLDVFKSSLRIDGTIWGKVEDFNMDQSRIGFGGESFIRGGLSSFGLPNLRSTFILADITDSHIVPEDIEPYVGQISENIAQLGRVDFTGSFAGFLNDFVASGNFVTEKGSVHSDINLKIPEDPNQMQYSGNLELINVDLGAFFQSQKLVQKVSMKGRIDGKGITKENANFDLNAKVYNSGFYGYSYDSITANGTFASNFFKGTFSVDDPNCQVSGKADLELNLDHEIMRIDLDIDSTYLHKLNITLDSLVTGGKLRVDIVNLDLDQFTGTAQIDSGFVRANNHEVGIDSINFIASLSNGERNMKLSLPGVEAELSGNFKITDAIQDLSQFASDYASRIQLVDDSTIVNETQENYKMELFAQFDNLSRYLDSLKIPVEVPDGSILEATFRESKNSNLFVYAQADYLKFGENIIYSPILEINGSKSKESNDILTNFILESDRQKFSGVPETKNLLLEGIWQDNNIDLTTSIVQEQLKTRMRFETNVVLSEDSILIKMEPSEIVAFEDRWAFNPDNLITVYTDRVRVENFDIRNDLESIRLEGTYSIADSSRLGIKIEKLNLEKANPFIRTEIAGLLDAELSIFKETFKEPYRFDGGFLVKEFMLKDFVVGDIQGRAEWNSTRKSIFSEINVERENFNSIDLSGYYYPFRQQEQLDFEMAFEKADLRIAQPFLEKDVSNLVGFADGKVKIGGSLAAPETIGQCTISEGSMRVKYLNTTYSFEGPVTFDRNEVRLDNFNLIDRKGAQSLVTGKILHDFFQNLATDLEIRASNFEFLNTAATDNSLYYGSANGSGTVNISGPLNDLLVKASIKTEGGTRLFVPVTEGGDLSQQDYIAFLDFSDTTKLGEKEQYDFQGLTVDFDIEVTPDAYCELIFDIKTGDIIRGRGRGNIKLSVDRNGEFHMFGPLEITDGAYNFTVPGFINKEFTVVPGSQITWFGDPYNGTIDLNAVYLQRADFVPLMSSTDDNTTGEFNGKVGINVNLNLTGGMLSPLIDFDLQIADKIDETSTRQSKLAAVMNNEQELKRQVISLLFLRRFSPPTSFELSQSNAIGNSVSEFFSNQLSYLVSQLDENLEVEVDLASFDNDAYNTFQLRLAYTFLDGRLKVTRGGDFANDQNVDSGGLLDDIVGDWSVEYTLTKDGRLRAKVFRSTNQQLSATQGEQNIETGVSLRFVHSFNEFRDFLSAGRKDALKRSEEENRTGESQSDLDTTY
ncbi:MAG: translocation/assembly module TamB domain-containing protein [Cyclobacteriaceae bacterium]